MSFVHSADGMQQYMKLLPMESDFKGENELRLFKLIDAHVQKFGVVPNRETVEAALDKKGWDLILPDKKQVAEPPAYYHEKVRERAVHTALKAGFQQGATLLNDGDPYAALAHITDIAMHLQHREHAKRLINFSKDALKIIRDELLLQAKGLQTPLLMGWPTLDGMTGGLKPGDVVSIIGRPAQGKTFALLYCAIHAWLTGQTPLVVSMEMNSLAITQRLTAMFTHTNLTHLKSGMLDKEKQLKPMLSMLKGAEDRPPFWIVDGALAVNVPQIKMLCRQLKPSCLYIDGAYLLRHENNRLSRYEKVTDNAERIKGELAEELQIPATISYQFNREASKKKASGGAGGLEDIAFTDAIGQLSSLVLGMMQEESVETMYERVVSILKGRNGEVGSFKINWRFHNPNPLDFSEKFEQTLGDLVYV